MRIRKKRNGMERYMRRAAAALHVSQREKKAALQEIRNLLLEIPHAEAMSLDILTAAAGEPELLAAAYVPVRRKIGRLSVCMLILALCAALTGVFCAGLFCGRQSTEWHGYVQSYTPGDELPPEAAKIFARAAVKN